MSWQNLPQAELDEAFRWRHTAPATPKAPTTDLYQPLRVTYEVSTGEPVHPDPVVATRFREIGLSDCEYGCKVYADPLSSVVVVAHNSAYGCRK